MNALQDVLDLSWRVKVTVLAELVRQLDADRAEPLLAMIAFEIA